MSKPDTQSLHEFAWEIVLNHAQDIERMSVGEIMADNSMFDEVTETEFDEVQAVVYNQARAYAKALMRPAEQPQNNGDVRAVAQLREELALVSDQADHAVDLLARTIGSTPCRLDSWGDCDAHGFQGIETGEQCPHALARAFLAGAGQSTAALEARDANGGE